MDKATYDRGLEIRKSVLGNEFVDKAITSADEFNRPMQDLTTEYCWGYVWGRDGLTRKTRSFLNLAMLCALNRPHELKTHIRGALANGATREEIPVAVARLFGYKTTSSQLREIIELQCANLLRDGALEEANGMVRLPA